jgi:hypothetical protein
VERVKHGKEALARNGEQSVATLDAELVDEDLAAGAWGVGHGAAFSEPDAAWGGERRRRMKSPFRTVAETLIKTLQP